MLDQLVTIKRFDTEPAAELDRSVLEEAGITAFLENAGVVTANWAWGNAVGYIHLKVPESQAVKARQLLESRPSLADLPENSCLACGAKMPQHVHTCVACGWSYDEPVEEAEEKVPQNEARSHRPPLVMVLSFAVVMILGLLAFTTQCMGRRPSRGATPPAWPSAASPLADNQ